MVLRLVLCCIYLCITVSLAQTESQVFLVEVDFTEKGFEFHNLQNISKNQGYNNQPFFANDSTLLYARNNEAQTDIAVYNINEKTTTFFNEKTEGGEYSPKPFPKTQEIAAVRLDPDGKQRLYRYSEAGSSPIFSDLQIAYFTFFDENSMLATVLDGNEMDLIFAAITSQKADTLLQNAGRSLHTVPIAKALSYNAMNDFGQYDVYQLDPVSKESFFVCELPIGVQDYTWWEDDKIFIGSGATLFVYDLFGEGDWQQVTSFSEKNMTNITRLAFSPDKKHLAFVAEQKN